MNFFQEDEIFPLVVDAAKGLATIAKTQGKPLRLDLDLYMSAVVSVSYWSTGAAAKMWSEVVDPASYSSDEKRRELLGRLRCVYTHQKEHAKMVRDFASALSDAFTIMDVDAIQSCLLVEEGHTEVDGCPINSWYVIPTPTDVVNLF